jgi:hypothetical protein
MSMVALQLSTLTEAFSPPCWAGPVLPLGPPFLLVFSGLWMGHSRLRPAHGTLSLMPNTLTPRQKKILELLGNSEKRPSIRDLAEQLGASNPMSIQSDLTSLYDRGYISKDRRLKRRIP